MIKRIGIDMDNVIGDSFQPFADFWLLNKIYENKFGGKFIVEKILLGLLSAKLISLFSKKAGRIREIVLKSKSRDFRKIIETMLLDIKLMPHAREVIIKLHKRYDVYFITTREYFFDARDITYEWLKKNKINIAKNKVIFTTDKLKEAKRLGIKIIIEDHPKIPIELAEHGIRVYLFDYPWNKKTIFKNIIRIKKPYWNTIKKLL